MKMLRLAIMSLMLLCVVTLAQADGRCIVISVGVSEYQEKTLSPLSAANQMAGKFAKAFVDKWPKGAIDIVLLTTDLPDLGDVKPPTKRNIYRAIDSIIPKVKVDDTVIFYFCGHGEDIEIDKGRFVSYILTEDCDRQNKDTIDETSIKVSDLRAKLDTIPCKNRLLFVDACRDIPEASGGDNQGKTLTEDFIKAATPKNTDDAGISATILACKTGERSLHEKNRTYFSDALIKGINGEADEDGNEVVTLRELVDFAKPAVEVEAKKRNAVQQPVLIPLMADLDITQAPPLIIACPDFKGATPDFNRQFAEMFYARLNENGGMNLIATQQINLILAQYQLKEFVLQDAKFISALKKATNATHTFTGSILTMGKKYNVTISLVSLKNMQVVKGKSVMKSFDEDTLLEGLPKLADDMWEKVVGDKKGTLQLDVTPADATVTVDDRIINQDECRQGIKLVPGVHKVKVTHLKYATDARDVTVTTGRPQTTVIKLTPLFGSFSLTVVPADAQVVVNDNDLTGIAFWDGAYEVNLQDADRREIKVTVSKDGYATETVKLSVTRGETLPQTITLQENPCLFSILSDPPGATLSIGGVVKGIIGASGFQDKLASKGQPIHVKCEMKGYTTVEKDIAIPRGGAFDAGVIKLSPLPCTLIITTDPADATVTVGTEVKRGPEATFNIALANRAIWKADVAVAGEGFKSVVKSYDLKPGDMMRDTIVLPQTPVVINIVSDFPGAMLYVNGLLQNGVSLSNIKPYPLVVPMGNSKTLTLRLAAQLEGEDRGAEVVEVVNRGQAEKTIRLNPPPSPETALVITSAPDGAQVWVNGALLDKPTPCRYVITDRSQIKREMTVRIGLTDYEQETVKIILARGENKVNKELHLISTTYAVNVTSNPPGAQVYINDVVQKVTTPCLLQNLVVTGALPRKVTVNVVLDAENRQSKELLITQNNMQFTCDFPQLKKPVGRLVIIPSVAGAMITAVNAATNDRYTLTAGVPLTLAPGNYDVTVTKDQYVTWQERIAVIADLEAKRQPALVKTEDLQRIELAGNMGAITMLTFSSDGKSLASFSDDSILQVWDVNARKACCTTPLGKYTVQSIAITPAGDKVGVNTSFRIDDAPQSRVMWCSCADGVVQRGTVSFNSLYSAIAVAPDGAMLAGANKYRDVYQHAQAPRKMGTKLDGKATAMVYNSDGTLLAGGDDAGTVKVWNPGAGTEVMTTTLASQVLGMAFVAGDKQLCVVMQNGCYVLLDVATGNATPAIRLQAGELQAAAVCGRYIAYSAGEKIIVVPLRTVAR